MNPLRILFDDVIADTNAYCRECDAIVPGQTVIHSGKVWLRRNCPTHGVNDALQSKHPGYYRGIELLLEPLPPPVLHHDIEHAKHLRGLFIDVTEACNLRCPNCLIDAKDTPSGDPAKLEDVIESLKKVLPYKPVLYLTGGEPTLLPDLDNWVRTLTGLGYDVKLLSNGIKLVDYDYCKMLWDAGCRWMLLQFDSRKETSLKQLRGRGKMSVVREKAIENLSRLGFNIDLASTVDRDSNFDQMGEIIRYGFETKGVRHVSLMPARRLGRGDSVTDDNLIEDVDMMDAIEEQTDGAIRRRDWVAFLAAMSAVYRTTNDPDFAPRRCFLPLPLLGDAKRFHPATRVSGFLRDPRNIVPMLKMMSKAGRAEEATWSERSLLISIETFREHDTIDVSDAARCSRYYLVDGKVQQACHRNVIDRPARRKEWEREHQPGIAQLKTSGVVAAPMPRPGAEPEPAAPLVQLGTTRH